MPTREWVRSRRGATITAIAGVLMARAAINAPDQLAALAGARSWLWFQFPFGLLYYPDVFWLDSLLIFSAAVFVMWATRSFALRSIGPVCLGLLVANLLVGLASDTVLVLGSRAMVASLHLPVSGGSWSLLPYDAGSTILWSLASIGLATLCAIAAAWLVRLAGSRRTSAST